jgi:hypothetical protein
MIGDIAMLAGYIAIWANDSTDDTGICEANADTSGTTPETAETPDERPPVSGAAAVDTAPTTCDAAEDMKPSKPVRLSCGKSNVGSIDAADVTPT